MSRLVKLVCVDNKGREKTLEIGKIYFGTKKFSGPEVRYLVPEAPGLVLRGLRFREMAVELPLNIKVI